MPFKTEIKKVRRGFITECTCDKCGNDICFPSLYGELGCCEDGTDSAGDSGFILHHTGGFYSKHDDEVETLVLCDDCFFDLVKEIKSKK